MNHLKLCEAKLSVEAITDLVNSPDCGATSVFIGTTRDNFEDKIVTQLEYEAYESMALKAMEAVCAELRSQWPDVKHIAIYHRLGIVPIKEASIVIAVSSPHRKNAMEATSWCIDNVKKSVPIFKKEFYDSSTPQWKENSESIPSKLPKVNMKDIVRPVIVPPVSKHLIQINVDSQEIESRIAAFMDIKRNDINQANIRDFCIDPSSEDTEGCARINSKLVKRKDSKGHLQVDRVYNSYSNQLRKNNFIEKIVSGNGMVERLENLESQLNLNTPVPTDIYRRVKRIEDRLLHMESICPEYITFWDKTSINKKAFKKIHFGIQDIDLFIKEINKNANLN